MAESDTILQLGIEAAREGNREEARNLFGLLTRQDPDNLQAWLWLAGVAEGPEQRRAALERVLELDPSNEMAQKGLQAMGVSTAPRREVPPPPAPAPEPPPAPAARAMSDEERYAAELDSAFDDYDAVPRVETPRVSAADLDLESATVSSSPTERPAMSSRERAERRAASRRENSPSRPTERSFGAISRPQRGLLLPALVGLIVVLLLLLGFYWFIIYPNRGQVAVGDATQTPVGGIAGETPTMADIGTVPTLDAGQPFTPTASLGVTPTDVLAPTPAPDVPPTPAPASDLAGVTPNIAPVGATFDANGWTYSYPNICGFACATVLGPQVGGFTAQGTYIIVLASVANNTGTSQPVPPDFFVLKDAQGNVYQPLPQVSSAYVQRGINADIGMEDAVPANGVLTSLPLLFDVKRGSTDLVLFTRPKPDQGWLVLNAVP